MRKRLSADGVALTERLCVYPRFIDPEWLAQDVLDVIKTKYWSFIPRRGSGRVDGPKGALRPDTIARARAGGALDPGEVTALFAETRPEAIEDMRQAADELRAELAGDTVTFVVNRNINVSNVCIVGCAFCGFGQGRRSPDAYTHERDDFVARIHDASRTARPSCASSPASTPTGTLEDYECWLRLAKETAPDLHLHAYSPMEVAHMCDRSGLPPAEVFARLRDAGLGSVPGTAAEVLHDGVRERISPNKLPGRALGRDHRGRAPRRPALDGDRHVRAHRGAARAGRAHARGARAAGAHGRLHRVRPARRSSPSTRCSGARTGSRRSRARRTSSTRPRSGSRSGATVPSVQASWVKMGLDAATEALRWGVNDLGGTLMEESISRLAGSYHGVKLDPGRPRRRRARAGRPAAERTTLYAIRRRYPPVAAAA